MRLRWLLSCVVVAVSVLVSTARADERVADHDFIGADRCQSCHAEAFAVWSRSPHARALEALTEKDRKDPRCLSCHTLVSQDLSSGLLGVQCESCHGGGRHYAREFIMKDAELSKLLNLVRGDEKTCTRCHTDSSPSLSTFDYATKREAIRHWTAKAAAGK